MKGQATPEDFGLSYYHAHGFEGDRTRRNMFGYPGLLRDLAAAPPWVTVEPEDVEGPLSEERKDELRSLVEQAEADGEEPLVAAYLEKQASDAVWDEYIFERKTSPEIAQMRLESFRQLVRLGRTLGTDSFDAICDAVFPFDEFSVAEGAPDLLVWFPDPDSAFWFFSEVKGPGDYVSAAQKRWLLENWDLARNHFLNTTLE